MCDGGEITGNKNEPALNANSIEVKGDIVLRKCKVEGGVDLVVAKIDGQLICNNGHFAGNEQMPAINADAASINNGVFLDEVVAQGSVALIAAKIDLNLECAGAKLTAIGDKPALIANGVKVAGYVLLNDDFSAVGTVAFRYATVGGPFEIQRAHFTSTTKPALDLRHAKTGTLVNSDKGSQDGWPNDEYPWLDGFVYERIADIASPNATFQLNWIGRQPHEQFRSQPFEQLADVLRKMGLEEGARAVMIAKNEEHASYVRGHPEWLWYGLFGKLIGYGYSPWRAFGISLGVILLGWAVFRNGYCRGLITPKAGAQTSKEAVAYKLVGTEARPLNEDYPKFNAFVYSLETFVPLVRLGVADEWEPNSNRNAYLIEKSRFVTGGWLRGYMWFHMIAGWILSGIVGRWHHWVSEDLIESNWIFFFFGLRLPNNAEAELRAEREIRREKELACKARAQLALLNETPAEKQEREEFQKKSIKSVQTHESTQF